jgi:hypothetical protein
MPRSVSIQVARDHLERLKKASGSSALMELIWNRLDADSKSILIRTKETAIGISQLTIEDNGHGIKYDEAEMIFGTLGGSAKKMRRISPGKRKLHGEEGKGRFKALTLGTLIKFESTFADNGSNKYFEITVDSNRIQDASIGDVKTLKKGEGKPGVKVTIDNINQDSASILKSDRIYQQIEEKLAVYYMTYPDFKVLFNKRPLDFEHFIKNKSEESVKVPVEGTKKEFEFKVRVIEWSIPNEKNIFLCNAAGISYLEIPLGVRTSSFNVSAYVLSKYIEDLHKTGMLFYGENEPILIQAIDFAKESVRKYVRDRIHANAKDFIDEAKKEGIYPYKGKPDGAIQDAQRKVFDILALNINEFVPKFSEQESATKKLTFSLVKEALESDSASLKKILSEAIQMPKEKQDELAEILEITSLADITSTIKEVSDRLRLLYELKLLLFEKGKKEKVLERKHLHKIVKSETWLFGDDYTYGADDVNLKNVLKAHLQVLGRTDFEEIIKGTDNPLLNNIPDICIYKQFPRGKAGYFENLVIELKRPSKRSGNEELEQVKKYARAISTDARFDQTKTEWSVILLVTEMDKELEFEYEQEGRPQGQILVKKNLKVYVKKWIDVISEAEIRFQYLKEKLNYEIKEDKEGVTLLKKKYSQYLPTGI